MAQFIKFVGKNKREVVMKAIDYYYDNKCEEKYSIFLAKCRIQKDHKTLHYYPYLKIEDKKGKNKDETKPTVRHRWRFSKLLSWLRGLFKQKL